MIKLASGIFVFILSAALNSLTVWGTEGADLKERSAERIFYDELSSANASGLPSYDVFELALRGYNNLLNHSVISRNILSIVDFSLPSGEKRLWVIDMETRKVLFNDLVAHGRNSGDKYAGRFSNEMSSNMSSLGFYITGTTYSGKHGLSLYLNGLDRDFNDQARQRSIVIHGADYVSEEYIKKYGRLGQELRLPGAQHGKLQNNHLSDLQWQLPVHLLSR